MYIMYWTCCNRLHLAICRYPRHWFYHILMCSCSRTWVQAQHAWVRDIQAYNSIILLWQKVSSHYCQSPATGEVKRENMLPRKPALPVWNPLLFCSNIQRGKKACWLLDCEHMWFSDHHSCQWVNMIAKTTSFNCKDPSFRLLLLSVSLLEETSSYTHLMFLESQTLPIVEQHYS